MKPVVFSPAAIGDIEAIWDYTARHWGLEQADVYIDDIYDACRGLASGARRGRPVDVRPGYLKLTAGSHMIYFRPNAGRIEVVRILHSRQDVDLNL